MNLYLKVPVFLFFCALFVSFLRVFLMGNFDIVTFLIGTSECYLLNRSGLCLSFILNIIKFRSSLDDVAFIDSFALFFFDHFELLPIEKKIVFLSVPCPSTTYNFLWHK